MFVSETNKEFDKFGDKLKEVAGGDGPLAALVRKMSEAHQLGVNAFLPKTLRPMATVLGSMAEQAAPAVTALGALGLRLNHLLNPLTLAAAGVGALGYAFVQSEKKFKGTMDSLVKSDDAMKAHEKSIAGLNKKMREMAEAGLQGSDAYKRLREQMLVKKDQRRMAKSFRHSSKVLKEQDKRIAELMERRRLMNEQGKDTAQIEALIEAKQKSRGKTAAMLSEAQKRINDSARQNSKKHIRDMVTGTIDQVKGFARALPMVVDEAVKFVQNDLGPIAVELYDALLPTVTQAFDMLQNAPYEEWATKVGTTVETTLVAGLNQVRDFDWGSVFSTIFTGAGNFLGGLILGGEDQETAAGKVGKTIQNVLVAGLGAAWEITKAAAGAWWGKVVEAASGPDIVKSIGKVGKILGATLIGAMLVIGPLRRKIGRAFMNLFKPVFGKVGKLFGKEVFGGGMKREVKNDVEKPLIRAFRNAADKLDRELGQVARDFGKAIERACGQCEGGGMGAGGGGGFDLPGGGGRGKKGRRGRRRGGRRRNRRTRRKARKKARRREKKRDKDKGLSRKERRQRDKERKARNKRLDREDKAHNKRIKAEEKAQKKERKAQRKARDKEDKQRGDRGGRPGTPVDTGKKGGGGKPAGKPGLGKRAARGAGGLLAVGGTAAMVTPEGREMIQQGLSMLPGDVANYTKDAMALGFVGATANFFGGQGAADTAMNVEEGGAAAAGFNEIKGKNVLPDKKPKVPKAPTKAPPGTKGAAKAAKGAGKVLKTFAKAIPVMAVAAEVGMGAYEIYSNEKYMEEANFSEHEKDKERARLGGNLVFDSATFGAGSLLMDRGDQQAAEGSVKTVLEAVTPGERGEGARRSLAEGGQDILNSVGIGGPSDQMLENQALAKSIAEGHRAATDSVHALFEGRDSLEEVQGMAEELRAIQAKYETAGKLGNQEMRQEALNELGDIGLHGKGIFKATDKGDLESIIAYQQQKVLTGDRAAQALGTAPMGIGAEADPLARQEGESHYEHVQRLFEAQQEVNEAARKGWALTDQSVEAKRREAAQAKEVARAEEQASQRREEALARAQALYQGVTSETSSGLQTMAEAGTVFGETFTPVLSKAEGLFGSLSTKVAATEESTSLWFGQFSEDKASTLSTFFGSLWESAGGFFGKLDSTVDDLFRNSISTDVKEDFEESAGAVGGFLSYLDEGLNKTVRNALINGFAKSFDAVNASTAEWSETQLEMYTALANQIDLLFLNLWMGVLDNTMVAVEGIATSVAEVSGDLADLQIAMAKSESVSMVVDMARVQSGNAQMVSPVAASDSIEDPEDALLMATNYPAWYTQGHAPATAEMINLLSAMVRLLEEASNGPRGPSQSGSNGPRTTASAALQTLQQRGIEYNGGG